MAKVQYKKEVDSGLRSIDKTETKSFASVAWHHLAEADSVVATLFSSKLCFFVRGSVFHPIGVGLGEVGMCFDEVRVRDTPNSESSRGF